MRLRNFLIGLIFLQIDSSGQAAHIIDTGDGKTFYRVFGDGEPLLLINGGPGMNSEGFAGLATELGKHNMVIIYDQRGTGKSTLTRVDNKSIRLSLMIDDIEAIRKDMKIGKWVLLGHSFGGMLAAYYTTIYPERVRALIFSHSGGIDLQLLSYAGSSILSHLEPGDRKTYQYWSDKINAGDTSRTARVNRARALAPAYVFNKKNAGVIAERLTQSNSVLNGLIWDDMRRMKFDCAPALKNFKGPVLVIQGKQDIVSLATAERVKETMPQAELVIMDSCVHYGWLDRPDIYYPRLSAFLRLLH